MLLPHCPSATVTVTTPTGLRAWVNTMVSYAAQRQASNLSFALTQTRARRMVMGSAIAKRRRAPVWGLRPRFGLRDPRCFRSSSWGLRPRLAHVVASRLRMPAQWNMRWIALNW